MRKFIVLFSFAVLMLYPNLTYASEYINDLGVVILEEDYNNLKKIYTEKYISVLDENEYSRIKNLNLDYDNVQTTVNYVKTEINNVTGEVSETYITEEEYEATQINPQTRATVYETLYKKTQLTLTQVDSEDAYFSYTALWKMLPSTRSFDVIGARLSNMSKVNGTQQGKQIYVLNGVTDYVQYNFNGTNINNFSNGFGISMNLLNSNVTYLECTIDASLEIDAYPATIFTSYQHATSDVTLAQSKSYTIGAGLGSVFVFSDDNIAEKYDAMQGTYDYFSS